MKLIKTIRRLAALPVILVGVGVITAVEIIRYARGRPTSERMPLPQWYVDFTKWVAGEPL